MQNAFTTHKHNEQTLRYLSMIADKAAEKANEGIAVADLDGSLLFLNEAWCGMHGYKSKDKLIGKQLSLFHTKEQMKTDVIPLLEKTKQNGQTEDTIDHIKSDGTVFAAQTEIISVGDEDGRSTGFIIFAANIGQSLELKDKTAENLKKIKHLSQRIVQLRKLFVECRDIGDCLAEQTSERQANNEVLLKQISELDQPTPIPAQYPKQILSWIPQGKIINDPPEDANPETIQPKEASPKRSEQMVKLKRPNKPLDPKQLSKVAELARRLSELSKNNILNEHKDIPTELEQCSTKEGITE